MGSLAGRREAPLHVGTLGSARFVPDCPQEGHWRPCCPEQAGQGNSDLHLVELGSFLSFPLPWGLEGRAFGVSDNKVSDCNQLAFVCIIMIQGGKKKAQYPHIELALEPKCALTLRCHCGGKLTLKHKAKGSGVPWPAGHLIYFLLQLRSKRL